MDRQRLTQVGRALRELGIQMIPAYSPQARGRSRNATSALGKDGCRRNYGLRGITTVEDANQFLRVPTSRVQPKFQGPAARSGTAFVRRRQQGSGADFFSATRPPVNRDNTVSIRKLQSADRAGELAGHAGRLHVTVHQHLDGTLSLSHGPHTLGRFSPQGWPLATQKARREGCGKAARGKSSKTDFPASLGNPAKSAGFPLSHSFDGGG